MFIVPFVVGQAPFKLRNTWRNLDDNTKLSVKLMIIPAVVLMSGAAVVAGVSGYFSKVAGQDPTYAARMAKMCDDGIPSPYDPGAHRVHACLSRIPARVGEALADPVVKP